MVMIVGSGEVGTERVSSGRCVGIDPLRSECLGGRCKGNQPPKGRAGLVLVLLIHGVRTKVKRSVIDWFWK